MSRRSLREMTHGQQVVVETDKTDRYGRAVGKVMVNGLDVNIEQLRRGLAWHYKAYQREQTPMDRQSYAAAEDAAKRLRRGLWAMPGATPPWEFRRPRLRSASGLPPMAQQGSNE